MWKYTSCGNNNGVTEHVATQKTKGNNFPLLLHHNPNNTTEQQDSRLEGRDSLYHCRQLRIPANHVSLTQKREWVGHSN